MIQDRGELERQNVFGETYEAAKAMMMQVDEEIGAYADGRAQFESRADCEQFAKEKHLDILMYQKSSHAYLGVTHYGDPLTMGHWQQQYAEVLSYPGDVGKDGEQKREPWFPPAYRARREARINGEQTDGVHKPLYKRNYFVPTGFYSEEDGTFNSAKPFKYFAKETKADTSHIYELLRHITGDTLVGGDPQQSCYLYLLAWLREKMIRPMAKTEVMPIFTGGQGVGKSSFAEVICQALFGQDNVVVSHQFDASARFNADYADALVVCIEEKMQDDKRNLSSTLKGATTGAKVRKENKGVDPIYQDSYTEYVMTTNEFVPIKADSMEEQRRNMVMEADPNFKREDSALAESVFSKLYGMTKDRKEVGPGLRNDPATIQQFKYELYKGVDDKGKQYKHLNVRAFPKTEAHQRCFTLPRTNEAVECEVTIKALAPFIKALLEKRDPHGVIRTINIENPDGTKDVLKLFDVVDTEHALKYVNSWGKNPDRVAINKMIAFRDSLDKPLPHALVDKTLLDMRGWLLKEYGLRLRPETMTPNRQNGWDGIPGKAKHSSTAWFCLAQEIKEAETVEIVAAPTAEETIAEAIAPVQTKPQEHCDEQRFSLFGPDPDGEFVVLNPLKPGMVLRNAANVASLNRFLLEADEAPSCKNSENITLGHNPSGVRAEHLYRKRLAIQEAEAERLFREGIVQRIVYSGMKSLHMIVEVADSPCNIDERNWLDAFLKATLSPQLRFDPATKDPCRLTRAPVRISRETTVTCGSREIRVVGEQRLLLENKDHIYNIAWRPIYEQWKNREATAYEVRGKMMPSLPIYKQAAEALLDDSFWKSRDWRGRRQETFFAGYRIIRGMGYTHDEIWSSWKECFSKPLELDHNVYKDLAYWKKRQKSQLIQDIDKEFDNGG